MSERANVKIHATADVHETAVIGPGTSIWNQCQVRENVRIGAGCILGKDVYIDFGVQIGDNVKIQNGALVYHGVSIEDGVFLGPGVILTNDKRPRAINPDGTLKSDADWEVGETQVGYGAAVGAGAIVLPGIKIGRFAMVAAGAVVTRDVHDHALVVGSPAVQVGHVCACGEGLAAKSPGKHVCPRCGAEYDF
jgi:UDP-2-acetamido-3-amino-2,3-dideoxy-glucuronate N-acetyltransferase